ncbi:MAG: serine/threonine-protein kinase [Planctomycetota bacterium]
MTDPLYDEALADLVARAMEIRDAGAEPDFAAICAGHEHLIDAVRQACEYADALRDAHAAPPSTGPDEPRRLVAGRYRLEERLGSGAMGVVYRATDVALGRAVALKLMRAFAVARKEAEARFEREAQALASVRHPAVVTVHDRGVTEDGEPFLVMELLEGVSIGDLLAVAEMRGERVFAASTAWIAAAIDTRELAEHNFLRAVVGWAASAAEGLHAAHEAALVHRDVKPSNLFLTRQGRVVLLDFGIASMRGVETITREGGPLGTPAYMAPESLDVDRAAAPSVDVYGLTATLYHLLTLRAPFRGTPSQVLSALAHREPIPAHRLRKGLPRDLLAILDKGMAKAPAARYGTASALAGDLRRFLDHRPVAARPVGAVRRAWRRARRSRAAQAIALTALLVAGSLVTWGYASSRAEHRHARSLDLVARLSPQVTLARVENRRSVLASERQSIAQLLDELVELDAFAPWAHFVRGMYRFDQDEREAACRDLDAAAAAFGTTCAAAVARQYHELTAAAAVAGQPDLGALPAPATSADRLLLAYVSLRAGDFERARANLADDRLADHAGAELLRLFVLTHDIENLPDAVDRIDPAIELGDRIARLESRIGRRLAWTRHMASFGLSVQGRFGPAGVAATEALDLSPTAYGSAINAGVAFRRAGRYDDAIEVLGRAAALRPDYYKPTWDAVYTLVDAGDLDGADRRLATGPLGSGDDELWRRESLRGVILTERAIAADADAEARGRFASEAVLAFERANAVTPVKARTYLALALAVRDGEPRDAFVNLLQLEQSRAPDARHLRRLLDWMPTDLTPIETAKVRAFLAGYADRLDPERRGAPTPPDRR